jgi:hypothetical protein
MVAAAVWRGVAALREPGRARRIAQALWIAWAIVVWNVVFDHVIVVAGREYLTAAIAAAHGTGPYARMDDWMRPAIARGLGIATAASGLILLVGFAATRRVTVQNSKTVQREGVA